MTKQRASARNLNREQEQELLTMYAEHPVLADWILNTLTDAQSPSLNAATASIMQRFGFQFSELKEYLKDLTGKKWAQQYLADLGIQPGEIRKREPISDLVNPANADGSVIDAAARGEVGTGVDSPGVAEAGEKSESGGDWNSILSLPFTRPASAYRVVRQLMEQVEVSMSRFEDGRAIYNALAQVRGRLAEQLNPEPQNPKQTTLPLSETATAPVADPKPETAEDTEGAAPEAGAEAA